MIILLIINIEVKPPDIMPKVNEVPTRNPIGRGTVLLNKKFKLCFLLRFCEPRQRTTISNKPLEMLIANKRNFRSMILKELD